MNSLNQQIPANALYCIRAGLWVLPTILLCVERPELRTANTVFVAWIIGAVLSLAGTLWYWRRYPWRAVMSRPVDWPWLVNGVKTSSLVWLGLIGLTAGSFVDRFVIEHYLTLEDVGVITFYFSFTNALLTLMQSGVAAFATPQLILHHRNGNKEDFQMEARRANRQISIGGGVIAVGLGVAVPVLAVYLGKNALIAAVGIFWLMLIGTWVRANAEMLSNILFARHQDRAIWLGNLLFLIPVTGGNIVLVPLLGLYGVGLSTVLAAALLFAWRWWHVRQDAWT
jgi:O-antigen/teichoic acid export membrane protein